MAVKKKTTSLKALHEAQLYAQQQRDAAAIAFVVLAEAGTIDAVTASEQSLLFAEWAANVNYTVGQLRQYGGKLYRCVQAHTSQTSWEPPNAASLWSITSDPAEEWPEWSQPLGAHDAYAARGQGEPQRQALDLRSGRQCLGARRLRLDEASE